MLHALVGHKWVLTADGYITVCDAMSAQCQTYRTTFPAAGRYCSLAGTKLYCVGKEAYVCVNYLPLAKN